MSLSQSFSQKIGNVRPLNPCPSLDIDFANGGYVNTGGFANQESVGSANFKIGAFNGPDPIFTRATAATFRGSNGLIQYAPENLLLRSEEFNDSAWGKIGLNTSGTPPWVNVAIAPNGTQTADYLLENGATSTFALNTTVSSVQGPVYTFSIYAKKNQRSILQLMFQDGQTSDYANFNLDSGSVSAGSYSSASITDAGNGWFRCSITVSITGSTVIPYVKICNSPTMARYGSYAGTAGYGLYIWGAQLERSSTARPYISTTTAARYGPRFEYDLSGNPLGLLMEEQSQNLLSYSEQFDDVYWSKNNLNTTGTPAWVNVVASPNGLQTAEKLIESSAMTGSVFHYIASSLASTTVGASYTWSVFAKKAEKSWLLIDAFSSSSANCWFDLENGVTGTTAAGATSSIVNAGNGWWRCSVTRTASASTSRLNIAIANGNGSGQYIGDGTSGIYIWGAQLEQKPFATSYIPTIASSVVRNADVVNSTIGSWYNTDEGTIVVKGDRTGFNIQDSLFEFTSGTTASLAHRGDGTDENFLVEDATTTVTIVETIPLNSPLYFAASYSALATQVNATVNAEPVQGTSLASTITTPTTLNIAYSPEISTYFNGHIKAFRYYAKALPSKLEFFTLTT